MSFTFNAPHESHVNTLPLNAHEEKDYPYFFYIYTFKAKNKTYFKPNASEVIISPILPTLPLSFIFSENEIIFFSFPYPLFNSRFSSTFYFLQVYPNTEPKANTCSVIIQNFTHHSAIFSPEYIGYIEVPPNIYSLVRRF